MENLNSDIALNDTEGEIEVGVPLNSRRRFLRAAAAASGTAILSAQLALETARASTDKAPELVLPPATTGVTPFQVHVSEATLVDLKRRLANTRWPNKEPAPDWSQGVPLAKARSLVEWESERTRSLSIGMRFRRGGTSLR